MKRLFAPLCAFMLVSCAPPAPSSEVTVSAAASLKEAFQEIGDLLAPRGVTVHFNLGGSGALQKQIEAGAPVDVFASAGESQMDALQARHLIAEASRRDFASNQLVLIAPPKPPVALHGFADLANVTRLAVGDPKVVPAGIYAQQTLIHLGLWKQLESRVVPANDVRQVLDYVSRGEVDAGLVYSTDLRFEKVTRIADAPAGSHDPIRYPIALVRGGTHEAAALDFVAAVCSTQGQRVLQKYGFGLAR